MVAEDLGVPLVLGAALAAGVGSPLVVAGVGSPLVATEVPALDAPEVAGVIVPDSAMSGVAFGGSSGRAASALLCSTSTRKKITKYVPHTCLVSRRSAKPAPR